MKLRADLVLRTIGSDHMIVDPGQEMVDLSTVYTLNDTAAWLWEQLQGIDFTIASIVELLCQQYEVTEQQALADAETLIKDFEKQGLLEK
ncbi:hypothetical protein KO02_22745 [Sphingobacterium sp. ML3W]|uniref:PqqD family protein n=1 Tax=Sphingobacterium sp. ML3W TaxID=1538644 RepID=UPI0004F8BD9A|nr:PqqD family protein [Sphingobacterium sp. ML3W]AIM39185.1 hypothetical protein KO02_22745 [Sphingobacterium sp. ML3W]